jgi:PhzF family phenazine biosynthesis protein
MTTVQVQIVSAFSEKPTGGNRAGVVLDASDLTDAQMQSVAREVGYSETAFVTKSAKADRQIRFFTPNSEVDLCGHATIATYSLLFARALIGAGKTTHELKAGVLDVTVEPDGSVNMQQNAPHFGAVVPIELAAKILRIPEDWIRATALKPQVVSTGLSDVLVPIDARNNLLGIQPDFELMKSHNLSTNTVGFHVFTLEAIAKGASAHCRNFAPAYDIMEEAATGSSSGSLAFEQGYSMNSPSEIVAELYLDGSRIDSVFVKGKAILIEEKLVAL